MSKKKFNLLRTIMNILMPWGAINSPNFIVPDDVARNLQNLNSNNPSVSSQAANELSSHRDKWDAIGRGLQDKFLGTNFQEQAAADVAFGRQKELQDRDFAFQQQMWEQTNAYNSPANQMSRLRDAGLNPHLAYGNPISEAQPMSGSSASAPMASGSGAVGSIFDLISIPKRLELLDAEIAGKNAEANYKNTMANEEHQRTGIQQELAQQGAQRVEAYCSDIVSQIEYRGKDFDLRESMFIWQRRVDSERIKQSWEEVGIKAETVRLQAAMLPYMQAESNARCAELYAQAKELRARAKLENNEAEKVKIEKELDEINLKYQRILEEARDQVVDKIKEGERADVIATVEENMTRSEKARREGLIYDDDWEFWKYTLLTHGSTLNPAVVVNQGKSGTNTLKQKLRRPVGFKK